MKIAKSTTYVKWNLIVFLISLTIIFNTSSCIWSRKNIKTETNKNVTVLATNFDVSAMTRSLINDIQEDLLKQNIDIKKYRPSRYIIDNYSIQKITNNYYISGMIVISDDFDLTTLTNIGVIIGSQIGEITTVQIPIKNFDQFLNNNRVEYFQISEKVHLK